MNGPHDMGGNTSFGPINPEQDEPWFHSEWERRAFALTLAMGMTGSWNIDTSRHARERIPATDYWASSYYEIWIKGIERLMQEAGLVTRAEIETGKSAVPAAPVKRVATVALVPAILAKGGPADRPLAQPQRFKPGDKVRARNINPSGHTRLPRYARGRLGEIIDVNGTHVFPDSSAHGKGDDPHWLYTVRFSARELWGNESGDTVMIDLWEPYLEAA